MVGSQRVSHHHQLLYGIDIVEVRWEGKYVCLVILSTPLKNIPNLTDDNNR